MKKLLWVLPICVFLLFGCTKKDNLANDLDEILKNASGEQLQQEDESEKKMRINLDNYEFIIPEIYDEPGKRTANQMKTDLMTSKDITIKDKPLSFLLYGGTYDENEKIFYFLAYAFNNTDREIENFTFNYPLDLTAIGGEDEGLYKYENSGLRGKSIEPKTITPIFIGSKDIKLSNYKEFYTAEELSPLDLSNILVYYAK